MTVRADGGCAFGFSLKNVMIHLMAFMPEGRTGVVMGLYSESERRGDDLRLHWSSVLGSNSDFGSCGERYAIVRLDWEKLRFIEWLKLFFIHYLGSLYQPPGLVL